MGHAKRLADRVGRRIGTTGQKDAGSLDPTRRFAAVRMNSVRSGVIVA
jgi:hypothetical protein